MASTSQNPDIMIDKAQELDLNHNERGSRAKRGGGKGRGGRGAKGGASGGMDRDVAISKALSKLLRHAAADAGLRLDGEGYGKVDQVMAWPRLKALKITFPDIQSAVADNAKQRFSMKPTSSTISPDSSSPSDWLIRANQGHSIAIESASLLSPISLELANVPEVVVHGTYFSFYDSILRSGGLRAMGRNHVHFSTGSTEEKQGVISGMRNDAELLIYVDVEKSLQEGTKWWLSENGVVLTEGDEKSLVGTGVWKKVVGRKADVGVLWEDGVKIAELPGGLRSRKPPRGKGISGKGERVGGNRGGE